MARWDSHIPFQVVLDPHIRLSYTGFPEEVGLIMSGDVTIEEEMPCRKKK